MFEVEWRETGEKCIVYSVLDSPRRMALFLVWDKDRFRWVESDYFREVKHDGNVL